MPGTVGGGDWTGAAFDPETGAFDKQTGELLWTTGLEAGATGAPMTYMHRGKQYVVFAIGGQQHAAEFVAFALP